MSFQLKKQQQGNTTEANERQEKLARRIVGHCTRWQVKWAGWMQIKAEGLSPKGKIIALLLFCLLSGAYCLHLVCSGFAE